MGYQIEWMVYLGHDISFSLFLLTNKRLFTCSCLRQDLNPQLRRLEFLALPFELRRLINNCCNSSLSSVIGLVKGFVESFLFFFNLTSVSLFIPSVLPLSVVGFLLIIQVMIVKGNIMPLHVDIKINEKLLQRIHIARMTNNGMQPDSINEYAVVVESNSHSTFNQVQIPPEPEQWQWDLSDIRFMHRYGDDEFTCLMKALEAFQNYQNPPLNSQTERVENNED